MMTNHWLKRQTLIAHVLRAGTQKQQKVLLKFLSDRFLSFQPFPDDPRNFSQQTSFVDDLDHDGILCVLAGNGAGKTECAAYKLARFIRTTAPPDDLCICFIVSEDLELTTSLWTEKLRHYFQPHHIEKIHWYKQATEQPHEVIFRAHANGNRWRLVFKSATQREASFKGYNNVASIWCDEAISLDIFYQLWNRVRKYPGQFKGMKFWTMTPDRPFPELEKIFNDQASNPKWKFYRMNSMANPTIDKSALEGTPEDMTLTRTIGAFCNLSGAVFKEFTSENIIKAKEIPDLSAVDHYRLIDFGFADGHETAVLWIAHDKKNDRDYVYHEWGAEATLIGDKVDAIGRQVEWADDARHKTYADSEDAQQRAEFANLGMPTLTVAKDVNMSIESTRKRMMKAADGKPHLLISDSCPNLIRQIKMYRWQPETKNRRNPKPAPQRVVKYDDDYVDCLRQYAAITDKGHGVKAWTPIKSRPHWTEKVL